KVAFLFTRVGLAGCDMGACAMLPRVIGQGRAAELLYTGRAMSGEEGLAWGFFNALAEPDRVLGTALDAAQQLASGPTFAHGMTKKMLSEEWAGGLGGGIGMEGRGQAGWKLRRGRFAGRRATPAGRTRPSSPSESRSSKATDAHGPIRASGL